MSFAALFGAAFATMSCQKDDNGKPPVKPPVVVVPNEYSFAGITTELKSMVIDPTLTRGITYILVSPDEGLTTYEQMTEEGDNGFIHEYFMMALPSKRIADLTLDVMTETDAFAFYNMTQSAPGFTQVEPGLTEELSAGKIIAKAADGKLSVDFEFTLLDGGVLKGHCSGNYELPEVPTKNFTSLDGDPLAVKSAFYAQEEGTTALYLTPSKISTARYLEDVDSYYAKLHVVDGLLTGEPVDITTTEAGFEFELCIPISGEKQVIGTGNLEGATGTFSVSKDTSAGQYGIVFDIHIGDYHIVGSYIGAFEVYDISMPNGYQEGRNELVALNSVVIDKSNSELYSIYLCEQSNVTTVAGMLAASPIIVTANPVDFNDTYLGFSMYPDVSIVYNGRTFNDENGNRGNTKISIVDNVITIDFQLFEIAEGDIALVGHYAGAFTLVQ